MHYSIWPLLFSNLFLCRPPLHPLMLMVIREGIVADHLIRREHTHGQNQSAANGFRRPGYNGYNSFNGTSR